MYDDDQNQQPSKHFPASNEICGSKIDIVNTSRHEGTLCLASLFPRANGAKRKPGARVTNSARLFTPRGKGELAKSPSMIAGASL